MIRRLTLNAFAALSCLAIGFALAAGEHDQHAAATETRQPITLDPAERAIILAEMRAFLAGVQAITAGISRNDMRAVAASARALGRAATHEVPTSLMSKLPLGFRQQGFAVHTDFDQMALDAEQLGDGAQTLKQLSETLEKCVACHAAYHLVPAGADHTH